LAVDVKRFREELVHSTRTSCTQLLEDLRFLRDLDANKEKLQARTSKVGWSSLALAGILTFTGLILLMPIPAAVSIGAFVLHSRHKRLNLENRRYELVSRVVELLKADISPSEPVQLRIDLRPETHDKKLRGESKTRTGWDVKHYIDPWLTVEGRLLDGTHFRLDMTERIDVRSRWKKTSRGKTKHKSKRLADSLLRVRLRVKPERYQHLARLGPRAKGALQLPPGTRVKGLDVKEDRVELAVLLDSPWTPTAEVPPPQLKKAPMKTLVNRAPVNTAQVDGSRVVAMSFLSLYQVLNLSRAIDKKAAHSPTS
jgi:hypothetical protein